MQQFLLYHEHYIFRGHCWSAQCHGKRKERSNRRNDRIFTFVKPSCCADLGNQVPRDAFQGASKAIFTLMEKDSFVRFKMTDLWLKYTDSYQKPINTDTSASASTLAAAGTIDHQRNPTHGFDGGKRQSRSIAALASHAHGRSATHLSVGIPAGSSVTSLSVVEDSADLNLRRDTLEHSSTPTGDLSINGHSITPLPLKVSGSATPLPREGILPV